MFSSVTFSLAQRWIARRPLQSVLFVLGVALGVAVVVAIDLANNSASRAFALSSESISGRANAQILGGTSGLPTEVYRALRLDLGLDAVAPIVEEYVRVAELGDRPMRLLGVDPFAEPPFRDYLTTVQVADATQTAYQSLNEFIAQPNTALISTATAVRYGVEVGDTISLQTGGEPASLRVVGTLQTNDTLSAQALDGLILADIATAQEIIGQPGTISRIDLILPTDYDLNQLQVLLPPGAALTTPQQSNGALAQMTDAFELNLQALSLLALVVGAFLIYNTVTFNVVQRRTILGVLRALGATKGQIFALILGEAVLLGAIGTVLGLGVGIIFGRAAVGLIAQTISDLYFTVSVQSVTLDPFTLFKGIAIGLAASIAAALVPSLDATRTPPAGSLRRSLLEESTLRLLPLITGVAALSCVVGIILLLLPVNSLFVSFGGLFAIVVGGALFTPAFLVALMRLVTPFTERIFGVLGKMAPRAVSRSLSRTGIAVAALTVAVSVIVGVSVMIESFRGTVGDWLNTTLGADIYVSSPSVMATRPVGDIDATILNTLTALEGIERVESARNVTVLAPEYPDLPPVNMTVATGDVTAGARQFVWQTADDYFAALDAGGVMVSEPFAARRGITQDNASITLLTDQGERLFPVIAVYYDYTSDQGTVFMSDPVYRRYFTDPYISSLAIFVQPGVDAAEALVRVQDALAGTDLTAQSNRTLREGAFTVFERTFSITGAIRLLAVVVAFIGILSALMALQIEGTRQYGVMRAVGMTARQLWQFTMLQTGLMGATAGLLALPIGLALAIVLIYAINVRSFGWTMQLNPAPGEFAFAFGAAVVAALLAAIYPAQRLMRLVTARALRTE